MQDREYSGLVLGFPLCADAIDGTVNVQGCRENFKLNGKHGLTSSRHLCGAHSPCFIDLALGHT